MTRSISVPTRGSHEPAWGLVGRLARGRRVRPAVIAITVLLATVFAIVAVAGALTVLGWPESAVGSAAGHAESLRSGSRDLGFLEVAVAAAFGVIGAGVLVDLRRSAREG